MATGGGPRVPGAPSFVDERPAAERAVGGAAAGPSERWPAWVRAELEDAVTIAAGLPDDVGVATGLYREWFNPLVERGVLPRPRPLVGLYRAAHAASGAHHDPDGLYVADRHDVVGADGWWRTWGAHWTPPRNRPGTVRLFLTPRRERLAEVVHVITRALGPDTASWSLACATDPRRMRRVAGATLDVADLDALPDGLLERLGAALHPVRPPLSLPLAPGVGAASYPGNGMSFGEHRCHLIALALRHPSGAGDPLRAIAAVFAAHGVDPARPYH